MALVIDTTSSAASLLMETAAATQVPVAYVTGLAMRRAADLYAGAAKTDPKDALVLADYARRNADRLSWTQLNDELLVKLRIFERTRRRSRRGRHPDRQQAQRRLVGPVTSTGAGHRRQTGNQPRAARRVGVVAHAHSAQSSRPFPHNQPHSQKLTTHSSTTDRRDHRSARRAESHSHSRDRLGRHHLRPRLRPQPDLSTPKPTRRRHRQLCSWSTPWEKSSLVCAGSARGPELEPSLRSATPTASPTPADSPPTPDSHPSTGNQAPTTPPENPEAATTDSKTPCSKQPSSPPNTTPTPAPTTNKNEPKANATTPPSSASPANAATSS